MECGLAQVGETAPGTGALRRTIPPMQTFGWLAIPVVATAAAMGWVAWAGRPRRPVATFHSLARYERFRDAVARADRHRV
jgi:hypothetical protein